MSKYTSIILFIPGSENEQDRIKEVNSYKLPNGKSITLIDVNQGNFPDIFPRFIYCASFNYFDTARFLLFLKTVVQWEQPENIRVMIHEEQNESLDYYKLSDIK
jgi:hypothetical protein